MCNLLHGGFIFLYGVGLLPDEMLAQYTIHKDNENCQLYSSQTDDDEANSKVTFIVASADAVSNLMSVVYGVRS